MIIIFIYLTLVTNYNYVFISALHSTILALLVATIGFKNVGRIHLSKFQSLIFIIYKSMGQLVAKTHCRLRKVRCGI